MSSGQRIAAIVAVLLALSASCHGFSTQPLVSIRSISTSTKLAAGKGFGAPAAEPKKQSSSNNSDEVAVASTTTPPPAMETAPTSISATTPPAQPSLNAGQKALAEMRRQKAAQRDAELAQMRAVKEQDQQYQEAPQAIPEKVAQRMGARMLGFVGVPLFLGLGSFVGFWYMATYRDLEFQPALVATTTIVLLAVSLLGITYSVMSTSWDEDRLDDNEDGGLLGLQEFQRNVGNLQDGLARSKENAILRDKMAVQQQQQQQRSMPSKKPAAQSLQEKLQDELE